MTSMTAQITLQFQVNGTGTLSHASMIIIIPGSAASQPRVKLITVNYGAGCLMKCRTMKLHSVNCRHDVLSSDELLPINCQAIKCCAMKCHGTEDVSFT